MVSRRQLLAAGWSKEEIDGRIRTGRLHRFHPGVYAVGHRLIAKEGWLMAAVLASGSEAVLSLRSAAALWGLRGYSDGAVHVALPRKTASTKQIRRHFSVIPPDERAVKEGIPLTSAARTIFDLASSEDAETIQTMLREAEYLQLWSRLSLPQLLERYPRKRGARKLQLALERLREEPPGRKHSKLEERFAPFLRRHQLPIPCFNDWILLGAKRYRVDCRWPGTNQIVELDGWAGHSSRSAFREDRERDRRLHVAGYSVTHLTWNQLEDEPAQIAADLRVLLGC